MRKPLPLYEYHCARCGRFEVIRRFSDAALTACPTCNGDVQKLFSAPAIQFKGSGWYVTDYARKDSKGAKAAESSDATKDTKKEETTKDAKSTKDSQTESTSKDTKDTKDTKVTKDA